MECTTIWFEPVEASRLEKQPSELGSIGETVTCVIAHPKHDAVLLGTNSGKVIVFDPTQGAITQSVQTHNQDVTRIVFTPSGRQFLTASVDGNVHLWDQQLQRQQSFETDSPVYALAVSLDGAMAATGGDDHVIRIFDLETAGLKHTLVGHSSTVSACCWVSDRVLVSGGSDGTLVAWEVEYNRSIRKIKAHDKQISQILISASRVWYVTASWDHKIKVWNLQHHEKFAFPDGGQAIMSITLTDDERFLVASYWDGIVRLWEIVTGKLFDEFRAHDGSLVGCVPQAGNRFLVTCDQQTGLRSWDFTDMGVTRYMNRHHGEVYGVVYTPDNVNVLSVGYDSQMKAWDRNDRGEIGYVESQSGPVTSCAVSPDNSLWALGTLDGNIKIWDVEEQSFDIAMKAHSDAVTALCFLPDGQSLISSSWDVKLKSWSIETRGLECTFDGHNKQVSGCDVSKDGRRMVSSSWDGTVRIWDVTRRDRQFIPPLLSLEGHTDRVLCCAFSPSGTRVATGSSDLSVRMWSSTRVDDPRVLLGHTGEVVACKFTPDGKLLLTADRNGVIIVWDAIEERIIGNVQHDQPILAIGISPDGLQAVIGDESGQVRFLQLDYEVGPHWIATTTVLQLPSFWRRGSPPAEVFEAYCVHCGHTDTLKPEQLGGLWVCSNCRNPAMICPHGLLPKN